MPVSFWGSDGLADKRATASLNVFQLSLSGLKNRLESMITSKSTIEHGETAGHVAGRLVSVYVE